MTRNPLTVSVLAESEVNIDTDVENQHQKLLPISVGEDSQSALKKNQRIFPGIRSLFGKNTHQSLPTEATSDIESSPAPSPSIRSNITSPLHSLPPSSPTVAVRGSPSIPSPAPTSQTSVSILDQKPEKLEGWLEKKNKSGIGSVMKMGHAWNRRFDTREIVTDPDRYFRVLEKKGQLAYYSSDRSE